jgi:hypothetical protein
MLPNRLQPHVFGELKSKLPPRPTIFGQNIFLKTPMGLNESVFSISFRKSFQNLSGLSNTKTINVLVKKKGYGPTFIWRNVP